MRHASTVVCFVGFLPGFPYLGLLDRRCGCRAAMRLARGAAGIGGDCRRVHGRSTRGRAREAGTLIGRTESRSSISRRPAGAARARDAREVRAEGASDDEPNGLLVVRAGLHTTVQDAGRWGYQHLGVPVGGALDLDALRRANTLVGNAPDEAALEVTLVGCTLRADADRHVAVTGARFDLQVNGPAAALDTALRARVRRRARRSATRRGGARAYVAVRGGLDVPLVLGSRSAWPLLPRRGALQDGDVPARWHAGRRRRCRPRRRPRRAPPGRAARRARSGGAATRPEALAALCAGTYRVASSASRMAYPLDGPAVPLWPPPDAPVERHRDRRPADPAVGPADAADGRAPDDGRIPVAAVVITADLSTRGATGPGRHGAFHAVSRAPRRCVPCSRRTLATRRPLDERRVGLPDVFVERCATAAPSRDRRARRAAGPVDHDAGGWTGRPAGVGRDRPVMSPRRRRARVRTACRSRSSAAAQRHRGRRRHPRPDAAHPWRRGRAEGADGRARRCRRDHQRAGSLAGGPWPGGARGLGRHAGHRRRRHLRQRAFPGTPDQRACAQRAGACRPSGEIIDVPAEAWGSATTAAASRRRARWCCRCCSR